MTAVNHLHSQILQFIAHLFYSHSCLGRLFHLLTWLIINALTASPNLLNEIISAP